MARSLLMSAITCDSKLELKTGLQVAVVAVGGTAVGVRVRVAVGGGALAEGKVGVNVLDGERVNVGVAGSGVLVEAFVKTSERVVKLNVKVSDAC